MTQWLNQLWSKVLSSSQFVFWLVIWVPNTIDYLVTPATTPHISLCLHRNLVWLGVRFITSNWTEKCISFLPGLRKTGPQPWRRWGFLRPSYGWVHPPKFRWVYGYPRVQRSSCTPFPWRIHGAGIYGNMDPINIPPLCHTWILWGTQVRHMFNLSGLWCLY